MTTLKDIIGNIKPVFDTKSAVFLNGSRICILYPLEPQIEERYGTSYYSRQEGKEVTLTEGERKAGILAFNLNESRSGESRYACAYQDALADGTVLEGKAMVIEIPEGISEARAWADIEMALIL